MAPPRLLTETEPARDGVSPVFRVAYAPKGPQNLKLNSLHELFE